MPNKYRHIKLPKNMLSAERAHTYSVNPYGPPLPEYDKDLHKRNIASRSQQLISQVEKVEQNRRLEEDKESAEIEVVFRGYPDGNFLKKYGVKVYQKEEDRVIGKVSNKKLRGQHFSDFERLSDDMSNYAKNNALRSYFDKIDDISPLSIDDVLDEELKKKYEENPDREIMIDVSFADEKNLAEKKLSLIKQDFDGKFVSSVNTDLVHFCRVVANFSEVEKTVSTYGGISYVEVSPDFEILTSAADVKIRNNTVVPLNGDHTPVLIFDQAVNPDHVVLKGIILDQIGPVSGDMKHGTAVASLVVCGMNLHPDSPIEQQNAIITVNAFDGTKIEEIIEGAITKLASKYPILLANLSINDYGPGYLRKRVSNFSILLDELAHKYNCLFFVSAGNINELLGDPTIIDYCIKVGYPNYFKQPFSYLLPPADSISSISVGSIAYQQSPNSVVKIQHPVPFTRINFPDNDFIKPDFVHYDGNLRLLGKKYVAEENGVTCASEDGSSLTNRAGTSFATPLVAHDAGVLHNTYPDYSATSIRALLTHFADPVAAEQITDDDIKRRLVGFGTPNLERTLYSLSTSATVVVEDTLGVNKKKRIKIPIPKSLAGDSRKRLRILLTLAYNPIVNPKDVNKYNPINMSVQLIRSDSREMNSPTTRDRLTEAYSKSNIKRYQPIELSTTKHMGEMWEVEVVCESRSEEIDDAYIQNYSLVATVEDMKQSEEVDIYNEIVQMIEVETKVEIPVEVVVS